MKLSVIIPCYNEESTLKTILDNVINESYIEKEIIVIDDFSTDNSRKILDNFHKKISILLWCPEPDSNRHGIAAEGF